MTNGQPRHIVVLADYGQFYVQDPDALDAAMRAGALMAPDRSPAGWIEESVGCTDFPGPEHRIPVSTGSYRLRVSYVPSDPPEAAVNPDEPGDHFSYQADMCPAATPTDLTVVKQGPSPWAAR